MLPGVRTGAHGRAVLRLSKSGGAHYVLAPHMIPAAGGADV